MSHDDHRYSEADRAAVYRAIAERRDMRHFRPDPVDPDTLQRLLEAAHRAPSVGLMQPWRFVRITRADLRRHIHDLVEAERWRTAEALGERQEEFMRLKVEGILDCGELLVAALADGRERHIFGRRTLPEMDLASVACAIQNLWLAARAEGLGLGWLERRTGKPVLGVLPYLHGLHLEAEDGLGKLSFEAQATQPLRVVVPLLPRISNHTDFDPLRLHPEVDLRFVAAGEAIPSADLVILPGSKNVRGDLAWLRENGWEEAVHRHLRYGGRLIGICGGFQMLGQCIRDPLGLEAGAGESAGLGLLDMETELKQDKQLHRVSGKLALANAPVSGYEIHAGVSAGPALLRPAARLENGDDGAISADSRIFGTYVHGLFDRREACEAILRWAGLEAPATLDYEALREAGIERMADAVAQHLDWDELDRILA